MQRKNTQMFVLILIVLTLIALTISFTSSQSIIIAETNSTNTEIKPFNDINNHWAKNSILTMTERGVTIGFPDGTFRPNDPVTADQFITMMIRAHSKQYPNRIFWTEEFFDSLGIFEQNHLMQLSHTFNFETSPTAGYWAQPFIDQAHNMGWLKRDSTFNGNYTKSLTREQAAYLIAQWTSFYENEYQVEYQNLADNAITDSHLSSGVLKQSVRISIIRGVMQGYPDGTFKPQRLLTRAEALKVMDSLTNKFLRNPYEPDLTGFPHYIRTAYDGEKIPFLFSHQEFVDFMEVSIPWSSQTLGSVNKGITWAHFYNNAQTRDDYLNRDMYTYEQLSIKNPFDLQYGITTAGSTYSITVDNTKIFLELHKEAYDAITTYWFGKDAELFTIHLLAHAEKYESQWPNLPSSTDTLINGRNVRFFAESNARRVLAHITAQIF